MNEQKDFIRRINELTEIALDQENVIFEEQLFSIFPEAKEDEAKLNVLKGFLDEKKIGYNEKLPLDKVLSTEERKYLDIYLDELKEQEPLTEGQRQAYMMSAMAGDEAAKMLIVQDSLNNVVEIAKLYAGQGVFLEDLIGEGNLALLNAVALIESAEDVKEAEGILAGSVMDAMQDIIAEASDASGAEEKLLNKVNKVAEAAKELADTLGRKVTIEELSAESGLTRAAIEKALKLTANMIEDIEVPEELK